MNDTIRATFYPPISCPLCDMAFIRERNISGEDVLIHPENHCHESGSTFEAPTFMLKRWYKEVR